MPLIRTLYCTAGNIGSKYQYWPGNHQRKVHFIQVPLQTSFTPYRQCLQDSPGSSKNSLFPVIKQWYKPSHLYITKFFHVQFIHCCTSEQPLLNYKFQLSLQEVHKWNFQCLVWKLNYYYYFNNSISMKLYGYMKWFITRYKKLCVVGRMLLIYWMNYE